MELSHPHPQKHQNLPVNQVQVAFEWMHFEAELRQYVSYKMQGVDVSVVDDVVQEVAIVATSHTENESAIKEPLHWLKGVARNKINDYWRKQSKHPSCQNYPDNLTSIEPTPYEWVLQVEETEQVTDAINQLPDDQRLLLEKKYLHGESCESLSKSLGKSLKSIEYRLSKARQSLRDLLNFNLNK